MRVHTVQAHRIFIGRKAGTGTDPARAATGVLRFAAVVFRMYQLTASGNPIAHWILIQIDAVLARTRTWFDQKTAECQDEIKAMEDIGYVITLRESDQPVVYENLSFGSPYGDAICHIVLLFDLYMRHLLTMENTGMLTRRQFDKRAYEGMRQVRAITENGLRVDAYILKNPELCLVTAETYEQAKQDYPNLTQYLGEIPDEVLSGQRKPNHYIPARVTEVSS